MTRRCAPFCLHLIYGHFLARGLLLYAIQVVLYAASHRTEDARDIQPCDGAKDLISQSPRACELQHRVNNKLTEINYSVRSIKKAIKTCRTGRLDVSRHCCQNIHGPLYAAPKARIVVRSERGIFTPMRFHHSPFIQDNIGQYAIPVQCCAALLRCKWASFA